jgi:hypothetical protein
MSVLFFEQNLSKFFLYKPDYSRAYQGAIGSVLGGCSSHALDLYQHSPQLAGRSPFLTSPLHHKLRIFVMPRSGTVASQKR